MCKRWLVWAAVAAGLAACGGCSEQKGPSGATEPRAESALRRMGRTLGGARSFSFRSTAVMDEQIGTEQTAQLARDARIVVRRPDRIFAEGKAGDDVLDLWYQGGSLTVLDKATNTTATVSTPGRIDPMLDEVAKKYGLTIPLADFIFSDPYKTLTADVQTARYVQQCDVDGVKCDHLLFTQEMIDWQIWIETGNAAVPRKFAIDYKSLPGRPSFTATFSDWNLSAPSDEAQFTPQIPSGAKKIELVQLLQGVEQGATK